MELEGYKVFWMEHNGVPPKVTIVDAVNGLVKFDAEKATPGTYEVMLEPSEGRPIFFELKVK